ncbi:conserved hypothetical protein [Deferribacter desulfuricans SSM1]|uniref:DUF1820 domain-containing protein n=1 Tax=Deferribacter desulfuricans (strain DSM 14783 / JCM 11476 / NBRC 101012 / SSM1) TaxID=639282 RepID=D3PBY8_DEFDS|nr:DUF1820 family protein [Deferribacter desulfuricans]BAI80111.1 conserved hypothetical protein [Deferribacter desulfuricans SSM1]
MKKKLYRIMFLNEKKELLTIHASSVNTSSFLGLIEISDIVFLDTSEILFTPNDDKIKSEFKDVERTFIPINYIVRIDEVILEKETPVIRLYKNNS